MHTMRLRHTKTTPQKSDKGANFLVRTREGEGSSEEARLVLCMSAKLALSAISQHRSQSHTIHALVLGQ